MNYLIIAGIIILFFGLIALLFGLFGAYNALIACKENVNKSWANIDVILKQRYDELPQLINICEQFIEFEQSMIEKLLAAREKMVKGSTINEQAEAYSDLTTGIRGLMAISEGYPELKSNSNFLQIQSRLSELENSLADRRELYNDSVNILNTRIQQIPDVIFATMMGITRREMFKVEEKERSLPSQKINHKK